MNEKKSIDSNITCWSEESGKNFKELEDEHSSSDLGRIEWLGDYPKKSNL